MSDESPEARLARVDERTLAMNNKLDDFIKAHVEQQKSQDYKIERLEAHRNWLAGVGSVLAAFFTRHITTHQ